MLGSHEIFKTVRTASGTFDHGHTYLPHSTPCAAALVVQPSVESENMLENLCNMDTVLQQGLQQRLADHPAVGDIRGRGLFWAVELVAD